MWKTPGPHNGAQERLGYSQDLAQHQHVPGYGNYAVGANRTVACWPRKHQKAEEGHQFIRPEKSRHAEDEVHLNNYVKD